ncbi:hypothetical protein ABC304_07640 [Microbacterium sp. 1P10UB]|uniref:hypothetical protein n=1 Tax=unclassified Microbacterium TaxID=2609290 RepID=UPI0039A3AEE1
MAAAEDRAEQIEVLLAEMEARLTDLRVRAENLSSRAGVLVASASITTSLLDVSASRQVVMGAAVFGLLAAALGVYALFPGRSQYANLLDLRTDILKSSKASATLLVADDKIRFYLAAGKRLQARGWAVRLGFLCLALSVGTAVLGFIGGG